MPNQIVDQQCPTTYPQTLLYEPPQSPRVKMMSEEVAAYQIESPITERHAERIAHNTLISCGKMRPCAIQQRHMQRDPAPSQFLPDDFWNFS